MTEDDSKLHAADALAALMESRRPEFSAFAEAVFGRPLQDYQRDILNALASHPVAFTRVTAAPDGSMKSEVYGQGVVYVGLDLAADDDFSVGHDGMVYALDRRINTYDREPDKAETFIATHRAQPSHKSSHLDRAAQSRAAKAAMIARARK